MMPTEIVVINVPLTVKDSNNLVYIIKKEVLEKTPTLATAVSMQNPDWETEGVELTEPLYIPFSYESVQFLTNTILVFVPPGEHFLQTTLDDYQDASKLSMDELKEVIELACFLGCEDYSQAIGFVIAEKMKYWSDQQIADFLGVPEKDGKHKESDHLAFIRPPIYYELR